MTKGRYLGKDEHMGMSTIPTQTAMYVNGVTTSAWAGYVPIRLGKERCIRLFKSTNQTDCL